ncbi:AraC family transcriptional regulator [Pandoraea aquatica]|uniref:AraC family transcriptional regulator n=1 Tax=Pandoraea aquatica TaxID=2508290 RepID=A0A5E4W1J7_9BURK|nr:AraC family transcriptional regulator [Pandoraea aquatica]VVE18013.1 AraC family transcriptional regulator [Pandoraea aquatica]
MLYSSIYLRKSPNMSTDPFSDILKFTNAESLVTGGFNAGGAWALRFPAPEKIKFFAVLKGECWVIIDGEAEPTHFRTGDVGLMTAKRAFVLASDLDTKPMDAMSVFTGARSGITTLGDGSDFSQLGGHVLLDPTSGRLLADVLPPWIHVPAASPQATSFRWLLEQLVAERANDLPGASLVAGQLAQMLFIQILRAHLQTSSPMPAGWLRALANPRLAPALRLMHGEPARDWHLEDLAQACAMSRTTFAFHFKKTAGVAPLTYLTEWRMRLAEKTLREERTSVATLAQSLGYASESAFSNAFKRVTGRSPKAFRNAGEILGEVV